MSDWKDVTIGDVADYLTGFPFRSDEYVEDGIKLLRGDNIVQGRLRWRDVKRWPLSKMEPYRKYELDEEDVVLAMDRPWIDAGLKFAALTKRDLPALLVQRTARLRGTSELHVRLLKYVIGSPWFTEYIRRITTGSLVPHISSTQIKSFRFRLPPLRQQSKIAAVLSVLDAKIDLNNRINAELEAMARTLYDYWFVQFDFPDENGKPYKSSGGKMVYNPVLKREIPVGWEVRKLGEIANITMGQSPPGASLNRDCSGVVFFQGSTDFGEFFPISRAYTNKPSRMARQGDILLSVRAPVGDMNIASRDCCIGRGLSALHSKDGYDGFLFYMMRCFRDIFSRRNAEGTTFGSITKDDLHSLNLVYPPTIVLAAYEQLVSRTRTMIFNRSSENESLSQLRDWLLPMLMNGQVTVE